MLRCASDYVSWIVSGFHWGITQLRDAINGAQISPSSYYFNMSKLVSRDAPEIIHPVGVCDRDFIAGEAVEGCFD